MKSTIHKTHLIAKIICFLVLFVFSNKIIAQRETLTPLYDVNEPMVNALLDKIYMEMIGMNYKTNATFDEINKIVMSSYRGGWKECWQFFNNVTSEKQPDQLSQILSPSSQDMKTFIDLYNYIYKAGNQEIWWSEKMKSWTDEIKAIFSQQGGICPTFIQPPETGSTVKQEKALKENDLYGSISIPVSGSLLRSDIPIYGTAGGDQFEKYKVEYGVGILPDKWYLIEESDSPRAEFHASQVPNLLQGDVDLKGNLATWNTGLKNWEHLPWHSKNDTVDFNGVYSIKLTVMGKNGKKVEDIVVCEVGRAIAQCLPGIAVSSDKKVVMHFREHSLMHPFRIYSIVPLNGRQTAEFKIPEQSNYIGRIYKIREPGDKFIKDVRLEFKISKSDLPGNKYSWAGISFYNIKKARWENLKTTYRQSVDTVFYSSVINELPEKLAVYSIIYENRDVSTDENKEKNEIQSVNNYTAVNGIFVNNLFERDFGGWAIEDKNAGVELSLSRSFTTDKSGALKITRKSDKSNMSVTACSTPFNISEFPIIYFDYRLQKGVKTDIYFLVGGRWYNLGFSGDAADFRNKDVNIENLGSLENIYQDDKWHSVSFNLYDLLKRHTKNVRVEKIVFANWNLGGYMKLNFGTGRPGDSYFIDNFKIQAGKTQIIKNEISVDDFEFSDAQNHLAGTSGTYLTPGSDLIKKEIVPDGGENKVLKLDYQTKDKGSYCGYWTALSALDLQDMKMLEFDINYKEKVNEIIVGLRYLNLPLEARVPIKMYLNSPEPGKWSRVAIPLSAFVGKGLPDLKSIDILFFAFEEKIGSNSGTVLIDNIKFLSENRYTDIVDFSKNKSDMNLLGGEIKVSSCEAAVIKMDLFKSGSADKSEDSQRITYGGNIGLSYGGRKFSYAMWETNLMGIDAREYKSIVIRIKGQKGGEEPNIYLCDGGTRKCLQPSEYGGVTREWRDIRLPLENYKQKGIDLSLLNSLQIVFEWKEMSGSVYIEKMWLEQ